MLRVIHKNHPVSLLPRTSERRSLVSSGWRAVLCIVVLLLATSSVWGQASVLTGRNDVSRDGLFGTETLLSPANVNSTLFGSLFSCNVDGYVSAQPLYVPAVTINGTTHNVVYVATEHDSVFAFDADNTNCQAPLWQVNLIPSGSTTVPVNVQGCVGVNGLVEIGILGTPVIDPTSNTLYVVAKSTITNTDKTSFWLHALDITSGAEKFGAPITINASVSSINGTLNFNPLSQMQRPALLLSNGTVFIAFGSNGCDLKDHGWLMAYSASSLGQVGVFNASPDVSAGDAIWMSGDGPAADSNGYIYLVTANGDFDISTGGSDYGDSVVKLQLTSNGLSVADYFTPFDQGNMEENDLDLGSGGAMLLPPQSGTYQNLLIAAGKTGTVYVINEQDLGQYDIDGDNNNQIPQSIANALLQEYGTAAYWNNMLYFSAHNDYLKAFSLTNGVLSSTPVAQSSTHYQVVGVPVVSANASTNGIVWLVRFVKNNGTEGLYAYNATPSGATLPELYDTSQNASRDTLGGTAHFATPIIANGKVYVGTAATQSQLKAYGLLPTLSASAGNSQSGTVATTLPTALNVTAADSYQHLPISGVAVSFSDGGAGGTFNPTSATTNSSGIATTQYTLPTKAGAITISATNPNCVAGSFSETATAGNPAALADISGGYQTGVVGTTLPAPLLVRLKDTYGNVVPGIPVSFTDNGAMGTFTPPSPVTTDSTGTATVTYTLPTKAQTITITPSYGTLSGKFLERATAGGKRQ
jgi:hypothetical protein